MSENIIKEPVLEVRDVTKIYKVGSNKVYALGGVSFEVLKGEFACIVGKSGSGKSTLLNLMAGLEKPTSGSIRALGKSIGTMNESALVKFRLSNVGFVFQSFNLFATHTAVDNVAMPLMYKGVSKNIRTKKAKAMLEAVGLGTHMNHRPTQMSGGQQQRVGIARALVAKPAILFADEPTGNLDTNSSRDILELIRRICKERDTTLIMVTHDPEIATFADRVITLSDGKIISNVLNKASTETETENEF